MKKIINGKLYNTETAKLLGCYSNTGDTRDFSHWSEELYIKKTGEYFIYGEGGPMTIYSKSCGQNSWCGGDAVKPITENEAKEWAESYLTVTKYEEIFGEVQE